ncbi:MAG: hypothetical protein HY706_11695 [Candidatus Hydrogenedentes bacterium]|nr:hypothetical protein [Candidatus Hydrogenedentota bacterium]
MKKRILVLMCCTLALVAIGVSPRYLEELRIGGGYGSLPDGGADFEKTGSILSDGSITAKGNLTIGKDEAANHSLSITAGTSNETQVNLYEGDTNNGGILGYDGAAAKLFLGTRNGSATVTKAVEISRGSSQTSLLGGLAVNGSASVNDLTISSPGANKLTVASTDTDPIIKFDAADTTTNRGASLDFYHQGNRRWRMVKHYSTNDFRWEKYTGTGSGTYDSVPFRIQYSTGKIYFGNDHAVEGGDIDAGMDGTVRGVLTVWDGGGGNAPGCIRLASPNGTLWYLFVEDDGTVKVHSALPTSNSDGTVVGTQF